MRLFAVGGNADHLDILLIKFAARIPERTRFLRSARRVVLGIEPKHDALSLEITQLYGIAVLVLRRKSRGLIAFFHHIWQLYQPRFRITNASTSPERNQPAT